MNNVTKGVIGILVFVIVVGALALMSEEPVVVETKPEVVVEHDVMKAFKDEYIAGCAEFDHGMLQYCECSYDTLLSELGSEGLLRNAIEYTMGTMTPDMQNAMMVVLNKCMIYIK